MNVTRFASKMRIPGALLHACKVGCLVWVIATSVRAYGQISVRIEWPLYLICHGLAEIRDNDQLTDSAFVASALGLKLHEVKTNSGSRYDLIDAPPGIARKSFSFLTSDGGAERARLIFFLNSDEYCVIPNVLQNQLGNLEMATRRDPAGKNVGVKVTLAHEGPRLSFLLDIGSGCLSRVEVIQRQDSQLPEPQELLR